MVLHSKVTSYEHKKFSYDTSKCILRSPFLGCTFNFCFSIFIFFFLNEIIFFKTYFYNLFFVWWDFTLYTLLWVIFYDLTSLLKKNEEKSFLFLIINIHFLFLFFIRFMNLNLVNKHRVIPKLNSQCFSVENSKCLSGINILILFI